MGPEIDHAVELIQRKDPQSLEDALSLLQGAVFSFSMKVCGQRQDAEDVMQEVLLKSLPYLPKFESPRALKVWLYKVAKNRCLMNRRRSKFAPRENLSLDELMPDRRELGRLTSSAEAAPEAALMRRENAKRLREAIRKLPAEYRLILVLHDMEELSDADIAEITGLRLERSACGCTGPGCSCEKSLPKRMAIVSSSPDGKPPCGNPAQPRDRRCKEMFAELSRYLDDDLDDSLCEELEKHMKDCEPCKGFLSSLENSIPGMPEGAK